MKGAIQSNQIKIKNKIENTKNLYKGYKKGVEVMSIKGTVRRVKKIVSRSNMFGKEAWSGKRADKITNKAYKHEGNTGNVLKRQKRVDKVNKIQRKDILREGAVNLGIIGASSYAGKKIKEHREGKTVKGRIKKAIGR